VVLDLAARRGGDELYRRYVQRLKDARRPDEQQRFVDALSAFAQPTLLKRTLDLLLAGTIPPKDVMPLVADMMAQGRAASAEAWQLFTEHFDALQRRAPRLGWLVAPSARLCGDRSAQQVAHFFVDGSRLPSPRGLQRAEEEIGACAALRHREASPLVDWLRARETSASTHVR
jgi:hypothetical protein